MTSCQRCNYPVEFIVVEQYKDHQVFCYLCTNCLAFLEEKYEGPVLTGSMWGDLRV